MTHRKIHIIYTFRIDGKKEKKEIFRMISVQFRAVRSMNRSSYEEEKWKKIEYKHTWVSQVATQVQIQTFVLCWCDFIEISLKIERAHHQRNVNRVYNQFLIRFQGRLNPFSDFPFLVIIIIFYRVFLASFFVFFIVCLLAYVVLRNFLSIFLRFYYDFSSNSIVLQVI